ncbi:MAG: hypothetical protein AAB295_10310 [Chloroflexota bacterium]
MLPPDVPRDLSEDECGAFWRRMYRYAPMERIDQLWPERLRLSWRVCRELARLKGLVLSGQRLEEGMRIEPSPWTTPTGVFPSGEIDMDDSLVEHLGRGHIALLPVGPRNDDEQLISFLEVADLVADRLGCPATDTEREALGIMLSPDFSRRAWPSHIQVMEYEQVEIDRVMRELVKLGEMRAIEDLARMGYRRHEVLNLIALARRTAKEVVGGDEQADRAMMVLKLDDMIERARSELKLQAELTALRLKASVQGLVSNGALDDGDVVDMARVVRALPKKARAVLPAEAGEIEAHEEEAP